MFRVIQRYDHRPEVSFPDMFSIVLICGDVASYAECCVIFRYRHQALACLEQLHDEGYHQEDVMASNFGLRNGQVVVLDFTHVEPCDTPRTCGNWEGKWNKHRSKPFDSYPVRGPTTRII